MINIKVQKKLKGASGPIDLDVDIDIQQGALVAFMGPSGAGKTTLLKMLAGIQNPDYGQIKVGDQIWFDRDNRINIPPQRRDVGLVFQDLALFPHMTVEKQLMYAMKDESKSDITEILEMMDLSKLRHSRPMQLSGGQRQRAALARSIVQKPKLLLLDEPLSALDYEMKEQMRTYIKKIHQRYDLTVVLVSHDRKDVLELCDHVYYLVEGRITREGKPGELSQIRSRSVGTVIAKSLEEGVWSLTIDHGEFQNKLKVEDADDISIGDKISLTTNPS